MTKCFKIVALIALLTSLIFTSGAQSYQIRVNVNANIRAQPSLNGAWLESVPTGTILEVMSEFGRWLRINRGGEAWMASWVSHERVETATAAPPAAAGVDIDNCCFVDRQCQADHEWEAGYWAFQSGQCQALATTSQPSASQPAAVAQVSDNCCGIDRQCTTEQEWVNGYWAYQRGQCGRASQPQQDTGLHCNHQHAMRDGYWIYLGGTCTTPSSASHAHVRITELTAGFTALVNRGFELLKRKAPEWYTFAITGINEVREKHSHSGGVYVNTAILDYHHAPYYIRPIIPEDDVTMAEFLVHEACHVHQHRQGRGGYGLIVEYECAQKQLVVAYLVGPVAHHISGLREFLDDPHNPVHWWW